MKKSLPIQILAAAVLLTGCETAGGGAALGGLLAGGLCAAAGGSNAECAIAAVAGAAAGYVISKELDERDRATYAKAQAQAASTGEAVTMVSPETQNTISFVPTSEFVNASGQTCKNLDTDYTREGELYEQKQVVCEVNGVWEEQD